MASNEILDSLSLGDLRAECRRRKFKDIECKQSKKDILKILKEDNISPKPKIPIKLNYKVNYTKYNNEELLHFIKDKLSDEYMQNIKYDDLESLYSILYNKVEYIITGTSFYDIKCGLSIKNPYKISDLVCAIINSITPLDFFGTVDSKGEECGPISSSIASNIIRVASQRIFTDPNRSFIEPISNSIDSYREQAGLTSSVGKFGMGFFSLLYWLKNDMASIDISSIYEDASAKLCKWNARITYSEIKDNYYFNLLESFKSKSKTGTTITITLSYINAGYLTDIKDLLTNAFQEIRDVKIVIDDKIINNNLANNNLGTVNVKMTRNKFTFTDNAIGISLSAFLTKLLVPSISTKTIARANNVSVNWDIKNSRSRVISINPNYYSSFMITIGDVGIYSTYLPIVDGNNFILSLPSNMPLPVSRDDIIVTDPVFYNIVLEELKTLIDNSLTNNANINNLFNLLSAYSKYADDIHVYNLIETAKKYLYDHPDVIVVPMGKAKFYNDVIYPILKPKYKYVELNITNTARLLSHLNKLKSYDDIFNNISVIYAPNIKNITSEYYDNGGLTNHIFVDEQFANDNPIHNGIESWVNKLIKISVINLIPSGKDYKYIITNDKNNISYTIQEIIAQISNDYDGKHYDIMVSYIKNIATLVETVASKDIISGISALGPVNNSKYGIIYTFIYSILNAVGISFGIKTYNNKYNGYDVLKEVYDILYGILLKVTNRDVTYGNGVTGIFFREKITEMIYKIRYSYILKDRLYDCADLILRNKNHSISIEKYREYIINHIMLFFEPLLSNNNRQILIPNPLAHSFLMYKPSSIYINFKDNTMWYLKYMFSINYIYAIFVKIGLDVADVLLFNKINADRNPNLFKDVTLFIYKTISSHYSIDELKDRIHKIMHLYVNDNMVDIIDRIKYSLKIYKEVENKKYRNGDLSKTFEFIHNDVFTSVYKFNAKQLISYVFENSKGLDLAYDWISEVPNYIPKNVLSLQMLEIAINEGTSKPFVTSVVTELTQNSVDASRSTLTFSPNGTYCNQYLTGKPQVIVDGDVKDISTSNPTNELLPICPNSVALYIGDTLIKYGDYENTGMSITMEDFNGIPFNGLIAMMIPFYSTKKSDEAISTGEMGTGFMNTYRQPFSKSVVVRTVNPNDSKLYRLVAIPIIDKDRVIDISYTLSISNANNYERGTIISVNFNKLNDNDKANVVVDAFLFATTFYKGIGLDMYINEKLSSGDSKMLYSDSFGTVYMTINENLSIITTNGIPFGELSTFINTVSQFRMSEWTKSYAGYGLIIDLNKSSYLPVQSRKRIVMSEENKHNLINLISIGVITRMATIIKNKDVTSSNVDEFIPGFTYMGDPNQVLPDFSTNEIYNFHSPDNVGFNISINNIIRTIIKSNLLKSDNSVHNRFTNVSEVFDKLYSRSNHHIKDIVLTWFSNKILANEMIVAKVNDKNKKTSKVDNNANVLKFHKVPSIVTNFFKDVIKQAWDGLPIPLNGRKAPDIAVDQELDFARGVYSPSINQINIDPRYINIDKLEVSLKKLKNIKNPNDIVLFMRNDDAISHVIGIKTSTVTFVHEFGHAVRNSSHTDGNSHGNFNYTIDGHNISYNFEKGSNDIFRRSMINYKPNF